MKIEIMVLKIVISRKQELNNRLRQIAIYIDDQKIGTIGNGDVKTFDVPEGAHSIKAKINWCGSRELKFGVAGEEKKYFSLSGFKYSNFIGPLAIVLLLLHLMLRRIFHLDYVIWPLLPLFLVFFYYLTIGRNDYLRLRETESW